MVKVKYLFGEEIWDNIYWDLWEIITNDSKNLLNMKSGVWWMW